MVFADCLGIDCAWENHAFNSRSCGKIGDERVCPFIAALRKVMPTFRLFCMANHNYLERNGHESDRVAAKKSKKAERFHDILLELSLELYSAKRNSVNKNFYL